MRQVCRWFFAVLLVLPAVAPAAQPEALRSPRVGVLCDRYFCADSRGISRPLTEQYLGRTVAKRLFSQGDFDLTQFTFANGIFCDTRERLCRMDRYYGPDGKHSGAVSAQYTVLLFPRGV
ncbi:hypothetical protein DBV23_18035 [Edwardsiella ictaluri]|uniref:Fels-1 Prophage Protein-like protein n=1 Tax=Edwardsiella ictaluri (strain 93-146) TaxID=634503 RepID=C5BFK6_EDWI9|nr:YcgJ family protein [Edwardsiella ictaluri]ACR68969.2 Fels-1 Prophage Protein-like protein [Edwardsiella ictaluri 93-146]AVZ83914.1 hypothetical protein DBV23_18035 [Edwardsiella ictaluri]EKS7763571.1 YcgJ family protein [Edwardsiella ictaluri]EKS7769549.1 YcgJ family protein [Edwardsiella ictaluri]EKS7773168.1 YcgJ family protein [Edwardsiella ictaluri]